jgi:hypothetical protein
LKKCRLNIRIKQVDMEQDGTTKKCFVFWHDENRETFHTARSHHLSIAKRPKLNSWRSLAKLCNLWRALMPGLLQKNGCRNKEDVH